MNVTVMHLIGWAGTGKTKLMQQFSAANPGSIQILTPAKRGQLFDAESADWANHSAIAVDDVPSWDQASVAVGIAALEDYAEKSGKKIIVVSQAEEDLSRHGVVLGTTPLVIRLEGHQQSLSLSFDGKRLTFTGAPTN
ncbi:TPA: hypothetical protein ACKRQV_000091 [Pseudomonas aeruginosa]|nr:hypothetical protein [Pseudomonas aeruginosa]EIU2864566.1 hypothetical protein [Pseudomonas aeruginosa]HEK3716902.1 hypothetical protein [Pseudomonas aeruginosa]